MKRYIILIYDEDRINNEFFIAVGNWALVRDRIIDIGI